MEATCSGRLSPRVLYHAVVINGPTRLAVLPVDGSHGVAVGFLVARRRFWGMSERVVSVWEVTRSCSWSRRVEICGQWWLSVPAARLSIAMA
jgi:hypothetical protein